MNLYHCMIELKSDAKALAFAQSCETWLDGLKEREAIGSWRLWRRKLGLASDRHSDFVLEIEVADLSQLESAFAAIADTGEEAGYDRVHHMIATVDIGLYRPYPDPSQRERVALI